MPLFEQMQREDCLGDQSLVGICPTGPAVEDRAAGQQHGEEDEDWSEHDPAPDPVAP